MTQYAFDVIGIGNALVDVLAHHDDAFIEANGLVKGAMTLIETDRATELYGLMGEGLEISGGSAANTIAGVASFGSRAAYVGRVHDDPLGTVFGHDLRSTGVSFTSKPAVDGPPTGRCLIIVTPDAQRTMNTYLGSSAYLGPDDIDETLIASGSITYLEGYLFDRDESKEAYWKATAAAHGAGAKVSLTLSDTFCVERHREDWLPLVRDRVDVLFANELEAMALWEVGTIDEAVEATRSQVEVGAITMGPKGSIIVAGDQTIEVPAHPVAKVVDTTGAGDLYAAGFLHGLAQGKDLATCGGLGSLAASAVLGHTGARPGASLAQLSSSAGLG